MAALGAERRVKVIGKFLAIFHFFDIMNLCGFITKEKIGREKAIAAMF